MIESDRLIIRRFFETDWQDLYEYLSLEETYIFEPGEPVDIEKSKKMTCERVNSDDFFAVVLKTADKMIGHLYFSQASPREFMTWELGYIFNPEYQRQGFCSEASKMILGYGFKVLKAHRINAYCNPQNVASWKVLEKIGLRKEGYFRKKAFFRKDSNEVPLWHDCFAYGLLEEDYEKKQSR